jgi:hypothetical protein
MFWGCGVSWLNESQVEENLQLVGHMAAVTTTAGGNEESFKWQGAISAVQAPDQRLLDVHMHFKSRRCC